MECDECSATLGEIEILKAKILWQECLLSVVADHKVVWMPLLSVGPFVMLFMFPRSIA